MQYRLGIPLIVFPILISTLAYGQPSEQQLQDAVLGKKTLTPNEFNAYDVNGDGKLDVADLVWLLQLGRDNGPTELRGWVWAVAFSFGSSLEEDAKGIVSPPQTAFSYTAAIKIPASGSAVSTTIKGFDPTKPILQQNIATRPSGAKGAQEDVIPGSLRPDYALGSAIPLETVFSITQSGGKWILQTPQVELPAAKNPTGRPLQRQWRIEIDEDAVLQGGGLSHGTVEETTTGFLPSGPLVAKGRVYLSVFAPEFPKPLGYYDEQLPEFGN